MISVQTTPSGAPPAPGFGDAVTQSQQTFRAALQALAHPGSIQEIAAGCGVPPGLSPAMTAMLLALADVDAPVWLPAGVPEAVRQFLRFHCGCPLVDEPSQARFAAVPAGHAAPELGRCHPGDPAYPDTSTTLLLEVESLQGVAAVTLAGPGIATRRELRAAGLPAGFWAQWRANRQIFPLGVDVFLIQGHRLCGLPRTVQAED
ncbi:phosphonate C-P lyase system protein PhnH [Bordetella petrii]|uniref:phosphonate C-P lyase system protein PhnH n=1 Tax=Bordetella petrii TaxID=94624 RepID=UPI001A95D86F|nr:phosphonate C-P lyase system protein PhnH [Bordetella petrii]MBO1113390.1 phosphonate C-P lyase system protein PhnH [Bordetella petrii]